MAVFGYEEHGRVEIQSVSLIHCLWSIADKAAFVSAGKNPVNMRTQFHALVIEFSVLLKVQELSSTQSFLDPSENESQSQKSLLKC